MDFRLLTPPVAEPVTLSEVKTYLRINGSDQDAIVSSLITVARQTVEQYTGRPLVTQEWEAVGDEFPEPLRLMPNLQSVESIRYYDDDNVLQTVASEHYFVMTTGILGEIYPNYASGFGWPGLYERPDAVAIRFTCGYGDAAAVPRPVWQAILLLIGHFFENRESTTPLNVRELPAFGGRDTVSALLSPFAVPVVR